MTPRAEQLATEFETVNRDLIATVEGYSDAQWQKPCAEEGWSIGVVAHHVAAVYPAFARIVTSLASGEILPPRVSMGAVHQSNAHHAREYAAVGQPETLDLLRQNGLEITELLHSLGDAQLDFITKVFGGQDMRVEEMVRRIVIGHTAVHLASIRATLSA